MRSTACCALLGLLLGGLGCVGVPSPLAPTLEGSIGVPHHGVLTESVALPKSGPGFERYRDDGVHWGTQRLVDVLQRAAARVAKEAPGGAPVVIGDLSERHGGKTERHRSHRTGRDVDILLYVTTPSGVSIKSPGFISLDEDGLGKVAKTKKHIRLDVERMWLQIKALVEDPEADVQWIFISRPLEGLITEYARALGEDPALLWRAQTVMKEPGDSTDHDDHIHVRLSCSHDDMVAGCTGGPRWPWQAPPTKPSISDERLMAAILDD